MRMNTREALAGPGAVHQEVAPGRMRVLQVIGSSQYGGGSSVIASLVQVALRLGWQVDVLATDPLVQSEMRSAGAGIVSVDVIRRQIMPWQDLTGLGRLTKLLRGGGYSLVHTHTSKGGFVGRLAARLAGVKVVVHTAHGFAFHETSGALELRAYSTLERLAAHWCDRVFTVSAFHRDWALRLGIGDEHKIVAIPNGIPPERVRPTRPAAETRSALGLPAGPVAILTAGRLVRQKGIDSLLEAAAWIISRHSPAIRVLLPGEGPLRNALQAQAERLGLREQVLFLGLRTDIPDLLSACDIVVLPSLYEGLSIALLEGMAAGKAIVATALGSTREVLKDGESGLLIPTRSPHRLADAILALAEDPSLRARLGAEAQRVYNERYTAERMMAHYAAEYLAVCREKGVA
jgi:glycosyltransferase involved in cell wall biosynthesis